MKNPLLEVTAVIPAALGRLPELASNLFFGWHRPTRALFETLDPELWKQTGGNPRLMLRCVDQTALDRAAINTEYLNRYAQVLQAFDSYLSAPPRGQEEPLVAYFCAEYGFHESFPIYSGGLGVLAGDYCKAASDECLRFVAVGLLYGQGYFTQTVDDGGAQHAEYREHDPRDLPVAPVHDSRGEWLKVTVRIANRDVVARLWRAQVGRVSVYLLDTNCAENAPSDRDITHRLYGGDESTRIRQEMILGLGGARALRALGLAPAVWHLNEGHAAFLILELLREHLHAGLPLGAALEMVGAQCIFTTHTPVAAGHDAFTHDQIVTHFADFIRELGLPLERFLEFGRSPSASSGLFNMTRLGLNGAHRVNGVSRIHGAVSSRLCSDQWPEIRPEENPVGFVTNGVHTPTFLHQTWAEFLDETIDHDWREHLSEPEFWRALEAVPGDRYWATGQSVKSQVLALVRQRLRREYARKALSPAQLRHVTRSLDPERPDVLTIGFARRFATYKRAALLLRDRKRLARLVNDPERPVVFLFAGKAHPADEPGKHVLREIKQLMSQPEFMGRIVFLEDYDLQLARLLVSGVDVWLNNPIAPLEASGTSGMKAATNGRLNLSVLDGWWAEGWEQDNGWGLPPANVQDPERRDILEADLVFDTLEEEVVPLYYAREEGYPTEWVRRMKRAMMTVIPRFNMRRVLHDYAEGLYYPAGAQVARLAEQNFAGARQLADWKLRVRQLWPKVSLRALADQPAELPRGETLRMRIAASLNGLSPSDVCVEFVAKRLLPEADLEPQALSSYRSVRRDGLWRAPFNVTGETGPDGTLVYALDAPPSGSGRFSTEVRIYPRHELLSHPFELGLMKWL